jgi:hypothetical protein
MTNTSERGEITSRENAKEAGVHSAGEERIAVKRRFRNVTLLNSSQVLFKKYLTLLSHLRR